ncbi:tRNA-modifying protein YgfZ [mine drainage metagenome]|uniref:tRNA-modifying protein YgfZ n=1 Tax=mine drainage metagenome TaxID=410659 RepID=A0A1J5SV33_9ZZZZ
MQEWQNFLQSASNNQNAVIQNDKVISFGDPAAELQSTMNETVVCDLSHLGLLRLQGDDTQTFLQGQVTNDIKLLNGQNAHYTAYCNPKGRMLALFLAFSQNNAVHLQMPIELTETIAKRLKMYIMRSKVTIEDVSKSIIKIGINGHNAAELLQPIFSQVPKEDFELVSLEKGSLLKLPGTTPRYEIFTDTTHAITIWDALKVSAKPVGAACWEWLEIQAGIPEVTLKTQEEFVPQMLNLDALNAINYKKGCYTGQEIVARTHYLGKVKRRTQLAHIASNHNSGVMPQTGDDILDNNKQAIGKIVRCAPSTDTGFDILAESRLENLEQDGIFWNDIALTIKALPYQLETSIN